MINTFPIVTRRPYHHCEKMQIEMVWEHNKINKFAKMILHGTVQDGRRKGRQKKRWKDNISEWTGFGLVEALRKAEERNEEKWLPHHP